MRCVTTLLCLSIALTTTTASAQAKRASSAKLDDPTIVAVFDAANSWDIQTLLPAIQNAEVKDLVIKVAPAFVAHRDAAQNLLNKSAAN